MESFKKHFLNLHQILPDQLGQESIETAAHFLLHDYALNVFGTPCRLLEIEFYLHCPSHPDPFTHCHQVQSRFAQWYFHRVGSGFKSGSFKGLDLTFGNSDSNEFGAAFAGVLIRSIQTNNGEVICGPSLSVDFLLSCSSLNCVKELDELVGTKKICDETNELKLQRSRVPSKELVYRSTRVGLSTKRIPPDANPDLYMDRAYRFMTNPKKIKKGRANLLSTLGRDGYGAEEIQLLTGSPLKSIRKYAK